MPDKCSANGPTKLPEMAARSIPLVRADPVAAMVTLVAPESFSTKALAVDAAKAP
jgi:hypothetical protein